MTFTQTMNPSVPAPVVRARGGMIAALVASLVLHAGSLLFFISKIGVNDRTHTTAGLMVQDIMLAAPPHPAARVTVPPAVPVADKHVQAKPAESLLDKESETAGTMTSSETDQLLKSTPLGLGMLHGYFSSISDGRTLRDDVRDYYFEMVEKINREWWKNAGELTEQLQRDGFVEVVILQDGSLATVQILQNTGTIAADRLMLKVIQATAPFAPLPPSFNTKQFLVPLRFKAPTNLLRNVFSKK